MNVRTHEEDGYTVHVYKGKNLYDGLTAAQEAFVRVIFKEVGEWSACSLSCVLAGETKKLVGITDLQLSLIRNYAEMHQFTLPEFERA
jgi:hypothetical protein